MPKYRISGRFITTQKTWAVIEAKNKKKAKKIFFDMDEGDPRQDYDDESKGFLLDEVEEIEK